ncbi:hypothetical protein ABEB36_014785 [Hypothenemus hampei]|uniref:Uncharacterized protein n=1 Tax=Hypothenemus hampei TaxID=57062 RepID=A0ABD1E2V1_HYPHA
MDTAEHTMFQCTEWSRYRSDLEMRIGAEIKVDNLVDIMLSSEENWKNIERFVETIMRKKSDDERERQQQEMRPTDSGGVGTPRSGSVGGGQAGPPRSSSDYRGSPGLSDQVPGSMATGKQEEVVGFASDREANLQWLIDPFSPVKDGEQRRDSTRSLDKTANPNVGRQSCIEAGPFVPPHRGGETAKEDLERFHSINSDANENSEDLQNITLISSEEEEIEQGNKRLRDETSPLAQTKKKPKGEETSNKISRMDTTVQQMCKQIDLLDKIVQGSHRPKQELKIVTNTLTSIAAALRKEDLGNVLRELDEISRLQEENRLLRSEIKEIKDLKNIEKNTYLDSNPN